MPTIEYIARRPLRVFGRIYRRGEVLAPEVPASVVNVLVSTSKLLVRATLPDERVIEDRTPLPSERQQRLATSASGRAVERPFADPGPPPAPEPPTPPAARQRGPVRIGRGKSGPKSGSKQLKSPATKPKLPTTKA